MIWYKLLEERVTDTRKTLVAKRGKNGRNYNLPTANEVAGLIVGDFDSCAEQRDIVIDKFGEGLQRINIFLVPSVAVPFVDAPCARWISFGYTFENKRSSAVHIS